MLYIDNIYAKLDSALRHHWFELGHPMTARGESLEIRPFNFLRSFVPEGVVDLYPKESARD